MDLPEIGSLDRRVRLRVLEHLPNDRMGFSKSTVVKDEVWGKLETAGSGIYFGTKQVSEGVTHRVYVRRYDGRTRPQDVVGITEVEIDGVVYRVRRAADVAGARRFTVFDVEEIEDAVRSEGRSRLPNF